LVATKKYYSTSEVAHKVIPSVSPLCIDGVEEAKKHALSCLEVFVKVLQEAALSEMASTDGEVPVEAKPSSQGYMSWAVSSLGFAQAAEPEAKPRSERTSPSAASTPQRVSEDKTQGTFFASSRPVSSSSSKEDNWEFDDELAVEEPVKPKPVRQTRHPSDSSSRATKESAEEPDLWGDLGMKAAMPKETAPIQRRKQKGGSKPMKLGAKKLNVD